MNDSSNQKITDPAEMIKYLQGQNKGLITRNGELAAEVKRFKGGERSSMFKIILVVFGTVSGLAIYAILNGGFC